MQTAPTLPDRLKFLGGFGAVFSLYTLTNEYASKLSSTQQIANVATSLDAYIPFIPISIIIYACSVPLLVLIFLTADSFDKLRKVNFYIIVSTLMACLCFYWLPLQVVYPPKSHESYQLFGINWQIFYRLLSAMDKPYNQLPSLHACYALIAAFVVMTQRNFKPFYKYALTFLSVLVGLSTLSTHQHHIYDIVFGVVLASFVIVLEHLLVKKQSRYQIQLFVKYLVVAVAGFLIINIVPFLLYDRIFGKINAIIQILSYYHLLSFLLLALFYTNYPIFQKISRQIFKKSPSGKLSFWAYGIMLPIIGIYGVMWHIANVFHVLKLPKNPLTVHQKLHIIAIANPNHAYLKQKITDWQTYQHIIWLDMSSESNSHYDKYVHQNISYYDVGMLDLMPMNNKEIQILDVLHWVFNQISTNDNTLIVCQCSMGLQRSVAMLACLLMYFDDTLSAKKMYQKLDKNYPYHRLHQSVLSEQFLQSIRMLR